MSTQKCCKNLTREEVSSEALPLKIRIFRLSAAFFVSEFEFSDGVSNVRVASAE
jgi:hypothetical protein